jgi:hypothetical protein
MTTALAAFAFLNVLSSSAGTYDSGGAEKAFSSSVEGTILTP